ncbi:MAG: aminotransferase class III-fold pyridoxal phosphate-dependent enzyme [Pseudomonadota bacterium]
MGDQRETHILARLTATAAEFSGYANSDLDPDATFLALGFDSLFLTQLASAYQKEFQTPVAFRSLITDQPTLRSLAAHLAQTSPVDAGLAEKIETPAPAPIQQSEAFSAKNAGTSPIIDADIAAVFSRQLELMREQLDLLRPARLATNNPKKTIGSLQQREKTEGAPSDLPTGFAPDLKVKSDAPLTEPQQRHLDRLIARHTARTAGSKRLTQKDRAHHADPRTAAGFHPLWKEMVYPLVVKKSEGAYLWDIDNNQYIDLLNGFGPNYFGHRAPFITKALRAQLEDGYEIGPQTPRAGEAARLMCELTGMDRVSWVNTGSEAVQAAIRIARTVTRRDKIVVFDGDYHGNFDEVLVRGVSSSNGVRRTLPMAPGIPSASVENVIVLDYGASSALDAIKQQANEIAAVLVEPIQSRRPDHQPKEFLKSLRALTRDNDIALVFDEVITGFRTCPGGAQEYFGVKADLATYGKIIGGGMPIGAVAGRSRYMDTFDGGDWRYGDASKPTAGVTFFAGTFVRHPMAIAAAHASLEYLKTQGPSLQRRVNAMAERMANTLNALFRERGVNFFIAQFASQMFIRNEEQSELASLFFYHMRDRGVHMLEGFPIYMTAAHTEEDVDRIIAAAEASILEMQADGVLGTTQVAERSVAALNKSMPLTAGQREIWIASQFSEQASCAFNESDAIVIDGRFDEKAFEAAFDAAVADTQAFHLRFNVDGKTQHLVAETETPLDIIDLSEMDRAARDKAFNGSLEQMATAPFDLEKGPLAKAKLFKFSTEKHIFVLYAHHLIFDGFSANLLIRDVVQQYSSGVTGKPTACNAYAPYSEYVAKVSEKARAPEYWKTTFGGDAPPPLNLPLDRERPSTRNWQGATVTSEIDVHIADEMRQRARNAGLSASSYCASIFAALLSRLSLQDKFVLGLPAAGQAHHDIETIGYCVNILPLLISISPDQSFLEFAEKVQSDALDAYENQDVGIGALAESLGVSRSAARLPLIEVVFNYSGYFAGLDAPGCRFSAFENPRHSVFHDLFFNIADTGRELLITIDYASSLFDENTIRQWINFYKTILRDSLCDLSKPVLTLKLEDDDHAGKVVALRGP